ncbi:MAG: 50S ribosomal protein L25/general stress protein Ctc [Rhodospirillales bacterium]
MAETATLAATPRTAPGKSGARAARREGAVPAVVYGKDTEPFYVTIERKALLRELGKPGFFIHMLDLDVAGKRVRVLPRDIQYHPVTDVPVHADFVQYSADRRIHVAVPVQFANQDASPGLKRGGVLNIVRHEIEVTCSPGAIPDSFTIDLAGTEIGNSIHASVISLPAEVSFVITDRDFTIATIAAPTTVAEEAAAAAQPGAAAAAPAAAATPAKS